MPELYNRTSHLAPCVSQVIEACRGACVFREYPCDEGVYNLCVKYMAENEMILPTTTENRLNFCLNLRNYMHRNI